MTMTVALPPNSGHSLAGIERRATIQGSSLDSATGRESATENIARREVGLAYWPILLSAVTRAVVYAKDCVTHMWTRHEAIPEPRITAAARNLKDARVLSFRLVDQLRYLDEQLGQITGVRVASSLDAGRMDRCTLSLHEKIQTHRAQLRGNVEAILDTTASLASGVAIGGVATTGILGSGLGAAVLGGATVLALKQLREFPDHATSRGIKAVLEIRQPEIRKTVEALEPLIHQEQHRQRIQQWMMATLLMYYSRALALSHAVGEAEKVFERRLKSPFLSHDISRTSPRDMPKSMSRPSVLRQMTQLGETVYDYLVPLVRTFHTQCEHAFHYITCASSVETTVFAEWQKAAQAAEALFKENYAMMIHDVAGDEQSHDPGLVDYVNVIARELLSQDDCRTTNMLVTGKLWSDVKIGRNLIRAILSSAPNFGAINYTTTDGGGKRYNYAVPGNITTVRAIARYIDAQAKTNAAHPGAATTAPAAISQSPDGSYTVADPDRMLYHFLAGAPTACANYLAAPATGESTDVLQDTSIGCMTIADYSQMLPGGTNTMAFQSQLNKRGENILKVRFSVREHAAIGPDHDTVLSVIASRIHTLKDQAQTPAETPDFSSMTLAHLASYIETAKPARDEALTRIMESPREFEALANWVNPMFSKAG